MEESQANYIPRDVEVWRPHFDPSPDLVTAVKKLLDNEQAIDHLKFYGSKEVVVDQDDIINHRHDLPIARADRVFHAHTTPIHFSGDTRVKLIQRSEDFETVRFAMMPSQQAYFNLLVNRIDQSGVHDARPQPPGSQHYIYFDVKPEDLPSTREERILRKKEFGRTVMNRLHFVTPDTHLSYKDRILLYIEPEPDLDPDDEALSPESYDQKRSA